MIFFFILTNIKIANCLNEENYTVALKTKYGRGFVDDLEYTRSGIGTAAILTEQSTQSETIGTD